MLPVYARRKRKQTWVMRGAVFFTVMLGLLCYSKLNADGDEILAGGTHRQLLEATATTAAPKSKYMFGYGYPIACEGAGTIVYILGIFYLFAGIAIVCDEFFVPALDVLTEYTGVSDDVAGATFMAAGGSAPELFTSIIGTFKQSEVGFGTIIGSAVFNVLFVIAMCAIFSKELLVLTWWPLARDSTYYAISLVVLALFFDDQVIQWWEAAILFGMYFGYVLVMKNNLKLYEFFKGLGGKGAVITPGELGEGVDGASADGVGVPNVFLKPGAFRAGLLSHLLSDKAFIDRMSRAVVIQVKGNIKETFTKIDNDGSGFIDAIELTALLEQCEVPHSEPDVKAALEIIDTSKDGKISFEEFSAWYDAAETKINNQVAAAFAEIDTDESGFIERKEIETLMTKLGHSSTFSIDGVWNDASKNSGEGKLSRDDFKLWYETSLFYKTALDAIETEEDSDDSLPLSLAFPDGLMARVNYLILAPLCFSLAYTVPDVRAEGKKGWFPVAFLGAIVWIGVYSFFMVEWAEMLGTAFGIPIDIMGLTFLAAGTSIPDLLTSVIVARQGHGDMAVSSSIGSNIFDVLVGLPLPWLLYCAFDPHGEGAQVNVKAEGLTVSILLLFGMLGAVIGTIAYNKWQMTKSLGGTMILLYIAFLAQYIIRRNA